MKKIVLALLFLGMSAVGMAQSYPTRATEMGAGEVRTEQSGDAQEVEREALKLFIPNAFTPNNDGINDVYYIQNSNFDFFEFSVFDRWGNQIYITKESSFRWDGNVGGRPVNPGIYVYVFNGTTKDGMNIKRSGTITIVR